VLPANGNKNVVAGPAGGITNVTQPASSAPNKEAQPGGSITWLRANDPTTLDPIGLNGAATGDGQQAMMVYDELVYSDNGTITPQTAQSLTSADAVVWTLKLKPNIKFSDGTAYDAAAVKFNYLRLQDPQNHAVRATQANLIQAMDVVDPLTLRLTLKAKNALFPQQMVFIPFIASPTAVQATTADKFASNPVGAGPYVLKSWVRDSAEVFVRNPTYWNAPLPYVDQVTLRSVPDETQRNNSFCTGQGNVTYVSSVSSADSVQKQNCGAIYPYVPNGGTVLYFMTKKPPMNDIRLRQAISIAIDMKDYAKVVDQGLLDPMYSVFRPDSPFYDPSILQVTYDPVKAQQLFDQVSADNGGGTINIQLGAFTSAIYQLTAQYYQSKLNAYNHVKVEVYSESSPTHVTTCNTQAYTGICLFSGFFDDPDPGWTGTFTCASALSPTGYCNPKFDALVADNEATLDPKQRIADVKEMQKIFYADVPAFYVERRYSWLFMAPNIQDVHYINDGIVLPDRVWIKSH
jgi:peptide/nickel transport system substrate-binding protein